MANYNLSADTSCINALTSGLANLASSLDEIINASNEKYDELVEYASQDPAVEVGLDNSCLSQISSSVATEQENVLANIKNILAAIEDYQDGNWSPENKKVIDDFLAANKPKLGGDNSGGGGGGGGGGAAEFGENDLGGSVTDDNLTANEDVAAGIQNNVPLEDATTNNDEEIVLGQVEGVAGKYDSGAVVPFSSNDETLDIGTDGVGGSDGTGSEFGTSLFGSSSFSVPSMLNSEGKVDGIKGAGVLGAAGVAAAAAAAIGGKVFYDKKHSDDEEDDMFDEDIAKLNEESGSDVTGEFMSGLNSVDFKSELLSEMDGDE